MRRQFLPRNSARWSWTSLPRPVRLAGVIALAGGAALAVAALTGSDGDTSATALAAATAAKLLFTLALFGIAVQVWKLAGYRLPGGLKRPNISVLETVTLADKRQLHVVNVAGRSLLLASTPGQVSLVAELDPAKLEQPAHENQPAEAGIPAIGGASW